MNVLFYTIVANYSIYAYNSRNFEQEVHKDNDSWISKVFHENDSYPMPLVLNPMRIEGNFDVNREEDLCYQRLMALYTDLGDDDDARVINDKKIAKGFAYNLEKESKFETITLCQYFQSTWKSTALRNHSDFLNGYLNALNTESCKSPQKEFLRQTQFWIRKCVYWEKYKCLFKLAEKVIEDIYKENKANYYENEDTDLKQYLKEAEEKFGAFEKNKKNKKKLLKSLRTVSSYIKNLTGLQFQRLVLIIEVCELWSNHSWFSKNDFSEAINTYLEKYDEDISEVDEHSQAKLNVIYETVSLLSQYELQDLFDVNLRNFYLFDQFEDGSGYHDRLLECFNDLFIDKERQQIKKKYDTLKLRQTINYLLFDSFKTDETIDEQIKNSFKYDNYVTFEELLKFVKEAKEKCHEETIALLPPPIFKGEILVGEGKDQPEFKISDLSSGELQMLNSISTYIYHLRNLNSLKDASGNVKYPYVNLILEEVELYFHPEYQRQYVYRMLRQIEQVKLEHIKAVNIILVTHSPIVLTDIPKNNVLFLKEGKPVYVMQENTFGANIHALLQNGFFLEGVPMGEFANKKINKMFEKLHNGDYSRELFEEIKLVSEPLLKTQLYQLFSLNKLPSDIDSNVKNFYKRMMNRIRSLEKKNEELEERIDGGHKII